MSNNRLMFAAMVVLFAGEASASVFCDDQPVPGAGTAFAGYVDVTLDSSSFCLVVGFKPGISRGGPEVEVKLADFDGPGMHEPGGFEGHRILTDIAFGEVVDCVADANQSDPTKVVAICKIEGESIGDLMRKRGIKERAR